MGNKKAVKAETMEVKETAPEYNIGQDNKKLGRYLGMAYLNKDGTYKLLNKRARTIPATKIQLTTPEETYCLLSDMGDFKKEHFRAIYLDGRRCVIEMKTISLGTLTMCLVHPREIFAPAIELRAASIIVAHNHPTGNTSPSAEDYQLTRRLVDAGELLGIEVVDHLIVGSGGFMSLRQTGYSWKPIRGGS